MRRSQTVHGAWNLEPHYPLDPVYSAGAGGKSICLSWTVSSSSPSQAAGGGREGLLVFMNLQ